MSIFYTVVDFFVKGGPFMIPILLVAGIAAAITIERYVTITRLILLMMAVFVVGFALKVLLNRPRS